MRQPPKRRQRRLCPQIEGGIHRYGQTSHRCQKAVRERSKYPYGQGKQNPRNHTGTPVGGSPGAGKEDRKDYLQSARSFQQYQHRNHE